MTRPTLTLVITALALLPGYLAAIDIKPRSHWDEDLPTDPTSFRDIGTVRYLTVHHSTNPVVNDDEIGAIRKLQTEHYSGDIDGRPTYYGDIAYHFLIGPSGTVYEGRDESITAATNTTYLTDKQIDSGPFKPGDWWVLENGKYTKRDSVGELSIYKLSQTWRQQIQSDNPDFYPRIRRNKEETEKPTTTQAYYNSLNLGRRYGDIAGHLTICFLGDFTAERKGLDEFVLANKCKPPTEEAQRAFFQLVDHLQEKYDLDDSAVIAHRECAATSCPGNGVYFLLRGYGAPRDLESRSALKREIVEPDAWEKQAE